MSSDDTKEDALMVLLRDPSNKCVKAKGANDTLTKIEHLLEPNAKRKLKVKNPRNARVHTLPKIHKENVVDELKHIQKVCQWMNDCFVDKVPIDERCVYMALAHLCHSFQFRDVFHTRNHGMAFVTINRRIYIWHDTANIGTSEWIICICCIMIYSKIWDGS